MINSTYQITFGIEVECVLAFHKSLLQNYLTATKTTSNIIKDIHEDVRRELRQGSRGYRDDATRHIYRGWALTTPTTYPPERDNGFQEHFEKQLSKHGYRAYGGEILHIAQAILPPGVKVFDSFSVKRYTDFSHWHLTHEGGIVGVDKEDLTQRLDKLSITTKAGNNAKLLKQPNMANDWDNHPLELVSRVLPYNFKSCTEMVRYLTALQEGPTHFAFATKHCGLHIHVGLPVPDEHPAGTPPPTFTLPTLQHIAYIQIMYQAQISTMHPPSRGDGSNPDVKSNLDSFVDEPEPLTDEEYDFLDALIEAGEDPDVVYAKITHKFSFSKARAKIFAPGMTIQKLSELMGGEDKGRIVNWKYIARMNGQARTLEFRQHEGTLCPVAIRHWLTFVVAIIRLAEHNGRKYGSGAEYDGSGYKYKEASEASSVWDLMDGMELRETEVEWWKRVVAGPV